MDSDTRAMPEEHVHFVTGRLAQRSLERILEQIASKADFTYTVDVLPITVAALMTPAWIAKHWQLPPQTTRVILPGYCSGEICLLTERTAAKVERGPRDLRRLPEFFSQDSVANEYGKHSIEILAEINHCPRLSLTEILSQARTLAAAGADWIDLGCDPDGTWPRIHYAVSALREEGFRVSVDSMNPAEVQAATKAGAELVLSVNSQNRELAVDCGAEIVVVPDDPQTLEGLDDSIEFLTQAGVPLRIDPILEPISFGFAASLGRYLEIRRRYPDAEIMMGIGNLTELTGCDSAGINVLLLGFCQELGIRSVLTTQVINWARTSVAECDHARKLMHYAVEQGVLPKRIAPDLVMLRDDSLTAMPVDDIVSLSHAIRDHNYRIFVAEGEIHLVGSQLHLSHRDPFVLMQQLQQAGPAGNLPHNLNSSHCFYLGYELAKARTALTLGKNYTQDESLDWGLATEAENHHYLLPPVRSDQTPSE